MAGPYHGTCAFIPPPPLPEFYTRAKKNADTTSTSSSSTFEVDSRVASVKEPIVSVDGVYDGRPTVPTMPRGQSVPFITVPPLPPTANACHVPPLAIYHICRLCLRPRSPRYHSEHPIPVNGLPPPPGICRRCRVTSIDETKRVAEIVTQSESNKIKIGFIQPFVADEDIISNQEMKQMNAEKYLRSLTNEHQTSQSWNRPLKDIVYRHVRVVDEPDDSPRKRRTKVKFTRNAAGSLEDEPLMPLRAPIPTNTSMQVHPTEGPPSIPAKTRKSVAIGKNDTSEASTSTKDSSSTNSTAKPAVKTSKQAAKLAQPECTRSDARQIARDEIERYRNAYWQTERMDSRIRELARQEVEHYRQAERKLEAHPDPYARGRLVPIERRIETERDAAEPVPWAKVTKAEKVSVSSIASPNTRDNEQASAATKQSSSTSTITSTSTFKPREVESRARLKDRQSEQRGPRADEGYSGGYLEGRTAAVTLQKAERHDKNESPKELPTQRHKPGSTDRGPVGRDPPAAERTKEQEVVIRQYKVGNSNKPSTEPPLSQKQKSSSWSSKSVDRDNWYDESVVKTIDTHSSKLCETSRSGGTPQTNVSKSFQSTNDRTKSRESRFESDRGLEMTYVPAVHNTTQSTPNSKSGPRSDPPHPEQNVSPKRVVRPADTVTEQSFRDGLPKSSRSTRDNDIEYLYAERTVQPAGCPRSRRPFGDHPPARHVEVEEVIEWRRDPVDQSRPRKPESHRKRERSPSARPSHSKPMRYDGSKRYGEKTVYYEHLKNRSQGRRPVENDVAVVASAHEYDSISPRRTPRMEAHGERKRPQREKSPSAKPQRENSGRQDPRVQFSSKVDISPTPPGSDASSSEIRRFHLGKGGGGYVNGRHSPERFQDLVDEYDGSGGMRDRKSTAGYNEYDERETIHERGRDREIAVKSKRKGEQEYDGSAGRPLTRALSESPSRESFSLLGTDKIRSDQERPKAKGETVGSKRGKADASHDKVKSSGENIDGRGPYRAPEKVTDSMRVEDGSPGGRYWDQREESISMRWRDV